MKILTLDSIVFDLRPFLNRTLAALSMSHLESSAHSHINSNSLLFFQNEEPEIFNHFESLSLESLNFGINKITATKNERFDRLARVRVDERKRQRDRNM